MAPKRKVVARKMVVKHRKAARTTKRARASPSEAEIISDSESGAGTARTVHTVDEDDRNGSQDAEDVEGEATEPEDTDVELGKLKFLL